MPLGFVIVVYRDRSCSKLETWSVLPCAPSPRTSAHLKAKYEELRSYTLQIEKQKTAVDAELAALQAKAAGSSKSSGYSIWVLLLVTVISSVGARFLPEDIPYI